MTLTPEALSEIENALKERVGKDAYRIGFFVACCAKKIGELPVAQVQPFTAAFVKLVADWANVRPWKNPFRDPYKDMRNRTRLFAQHWKLDEDFIKAMG